MRSYKGKDHFFKSMNKKPEQQKVLDNLADYSIEDLENLRGPQFPKWVRQALVKLKEVEIMNDNRGGRTADEMAAILALKMTKAGLDKED